MNLTQRHAPPVPRTPVAVQAQAGSATHSGRYRERDFGIGYGASSGYALEKRYTSDWGQVRFRCR